MIPREPWPQSAVGARWFFSPLIHLSLPCLRKLPSISQRPGSRQLWERLSIPASLGFSDHRDWRLPFSRRGPRPATTFYPRRLIAVRPMPYASLDALGKPEREADPSLLRRAELLPGISTVRSPSPDLGIPRSARRSSFLMRLRFAGRCSRLGFGSFRRFPPSPSLGQTKRVVDLALPLRQLGAFGRHSALQIFP